MAELRKKQHWVPFASGMDFFGGGLPHNLKKIYVFFLIIIYVCCWDLAIHYSRKQFYIFFFTFFPFRKVDFRFLRSMILQSLVIEFY